MKKILLIAAFGATGLISAKNITEAELKDTNEKVENNCVKTLYCQEYAITTWCNPNNVIVDTVCYNPDNAADRAHAFACMDENARLTNVFFCGRENPRITKDVSIN